MRHETVFLFFRGAVLELWWLSSRQVDLVAA